MKSLFVMMIFLVSSVGTAASVGVCNDTKKVTKAAEMAFPRKEDPFGDNARFIMTARGNDRWEVDMTYHDQCYRTVTVYMKAGTCTVANVKKGHETCTDD